MKLDIKLFNPKLGHNIMIVDGLIEMLNELKKNLNTKYYEDYNISVEKLHRFTTVVFKTLNNDIIAKSKIPSYFDDNDNQNNENQNNDNQNNYNIDDDMDNDCDNNINMEGEEEDDDDNSSFGSISEYEEDEDADKEDENIILKTFDEIHNQYYLYLDRFDFEYEKIY